MSYTYSLYRLRGVQTPVEARANLTGTVWGCFVPLFGLRGDALIAISSGGDGGNETERLEQSIWHPTVRPATPTPLERPGLYVFRRFAIDPADADELVQLSAAAWQTFESDDDFRTEPMGLFQPESVNAHGELEMALVTWYDGFTSWETSRTPHPEARANFAARRRLLKWTHAIATRLVLA